MARYEEKGGRCLECSENVVLKRKERQPLMHLFLTLSTGGLWLFVWLYLMFRTTGWFCSLCGSKEVVSKRLRERAA